MDKFRRYRGGNGSVGKARRDTDAGSSPRSGKNFFSQTQLPVQTVLRCPYSPRVQSHASTFMCTLKNTKLAAIPVFGKAKILHTLMGTGGSALAVVVPDPGKTTRISRKGQ